MHTRLGLKRDNHYLPVCYQKGFVDSFQKVWVKFAGREKPEHKYPKSVGKQTDLYVRTIGGVKDDKVEEFFSKSVEFHFAKLSQRVRREQDNLSNLTVRERKALLAFVASQVVRIPANKGSMEEQLGRALGTNEFLTEMGKQMKAIIEAWGKNAPSFEFYTSLPYVGDRFITGDDPVVQEIARNSPLWTPTENARLEVGPITEILKSPGVSWTVAVTPYICATLRSQGGGEMILPPQTMEPSSVRRFNAKIREQCKLFTLARDADSLA